MIDRIYELKKKIAELEWLESKGIQTFSCTDLLESSRKELTELEAQLNKAA